LWEWVGGGEGRPDGSASADAVVYDRLDSSTSRWPSTVTSRRQASSSSDPELLDGGRATLAAMSTDALRRELAAIVAELRAEIAAGRAPAADGAAARIRAAADRARQAAPVAAVTSAERAALQQLERLVAVHRARALVSHEPAAPRAAVPQRRRALLRTRPTITGNMDVKRARHGDAFTLGWDGESRVEAWEVRLSEQRGRGADYVVRETLTLPGDATAVDVPLGDAPLRVHLLGRGRDGRLLRRAIVSGLTRESWDERWERRASAS
jgi:hypothetical protein